MISIIVAMDDNQLIGQAGTVHGMPWTNREDLKHFQKTTMNKTIVIGRTTYQAMGKALPNRKTIVLSSQLPDDPAIEVRRSLEDVIQDYREKEEDLYIAGGASVYQQALPLADQLLISRIPGQYKGETYFPDFSNYGYKQVDVRAFETFTLYIYERGVL